MWAYCMWHLWDSLTKYFDFLSFWANSKFGAILKFNLHNGPKWKGKNMWAILKFECISSHVILSLSQQFWAISRYISYDLFYICEAPYIQAFDLEAPGSIQVQGFLTATRTPKYDFVGISEDIVAMDCYGLVQAGIIINDFRPNLNLHGKLLI